MDITDFLDGKVPNESNKYIKRLSRKITELGQVEQPVINLLEKTYLIEFIKSPGSAINVSWFNSLINRLNAVNPTIKPNALALFPDLVDYSPEKLLGRLVETNTDMEFTSDQKSSIVNILEFIGSHTERTYGLFGTAGSGKSTTSVELINFLILNNFIRSVAFAAPTNKAVGILKSKMRSNIKKLAEKITGKKLDEGIYSLEDLINMLKDKDIIIEFITIHRLLNFKSDVNTGGDRIFVKSGSSSILNYDIVITDECSMIQLQMVSTLFDDIQKLYISSGDNFKRVPKLIFAGDLAQLPPVNEIVSAIFIKSADELPYEFYIRILSLTDKTIKKLAESKEIKAKYESLISDILGMKCSVLFEVVRTKIDCIIKLANAIRDWIFGKINWPNVSQFLGDKLYLYKHDNKKPKSESDWFKQFLLQQTTTVQEGNINTSNIILTWSNPQTKIYNEAIRTIMFKDKQKIEKFEPGDILMLNDFYNWDETAIKGPDMKTRFYTSEQIRVCTIDIQEKVLSNFIEDVGKSVLRLKSSDLLLGKYKNLIKNLNFKNKKKYTCWKLFVQRVGENVPNSIQKTYIIYVLHDISEFQLKADHDYSLNQIKEFGDSLTKTFPDLTNTIERDLMRPLWKQFNKIFIDSFAQVSYGNSHTVHKSQGSSFYNVFIDIDDIMNNPNTDEMKRCIYTAITRSSNEVHLLV